MQDVPTPPSGLQTAEFLGKSLTCECPQYRFDDKLFKNGRCPLCGKILPETARRFFEGSDERKG